MKIAVLGTGVVGQTIAEKLTQVGHEVMFGTRSAAESLAKTGEGNFGRPAFGAWYTQHQDKMKLGTFAEAAAWGDMLVNATNGMGTLAALELAGAANMKDKVLLDISNPLDFSKGFPPSLSVCNTDSLGEQIQRAFPDTKVVKSLNTLNAYLMVGPGLLPEAHNIFMSGNDEDAKAVVLTLLQSFGWPADSVIDLGDITTARGTEQLLPIWVRLMGTLKNNGMFNFKIVKA